MKGMPSHLRAWAEINLAALERNLKAIRLAMPEHLKTIAVVKANAYGHGIAPVVARLMHAQADAFAVANLEEASRIRELGTGWPVLVLSVLLPEEYRDALRLNVSAIVSSLEEAQQMADIARKNEKRFKVHLKIDTGMGRLGAWHPELKPILDFVIRSEFLLLEGICTHFAAADSNREFTELQRQRFKDALQNVDPHLQAKLLLHADNSAGVPSFSPNGPFNAIRVGLLQFGISPNPHGLLKTIHTEPVLSFHSRVGLIKTLPSGCTVSYGMTCKLNRPSRIAILTAGYADGLTTAFSNRGSVLINGARCPIIGRVTMDQCIADVTDLQQAPKVGQRATFIGRSESEVLSVGEFAKASGQIEWEALCSLSNRTRRVYLNDSSN